jgi:hypothetical protein
MIGLVWTLARLWPVMMWPALAHGEDRSDQLETPVASSCVGRGIVPYASQSSASNQDLALVRIDHVGAAVGLTR